MQMPKNARNKEVRFLIAGVLKHRLTPRSGGLVQILCNPRHFARVVKLAAILSVMAAWREISGSACDPRRGVSVVGGTLDPVDDEDFERRACRFQPEAELLLQGGEDRRGIAAVGRGGRVASVR